MLRLANVQRELRGIVIALLMVGATIIVSAMLTHFLDIRRGSVIYLIPVLLAGWHLGRRRSPARRWACRRPRAHDPEFGRWQMAKIVRENDVAAARRGRDRG